MAFPATDFRFRHGTLHFLAKRGYLDALLKQNRERPADSTPQLHKLAGVGLLDSRHGARSAQTPAPAFPGGLEQTAVFFVPPPEIVAIEVATVFARRSPHSWF